MSTAWYKSRSIPKRIRSWTSSSNSGIINHPGLPPAPSPAGAPEATTNRHRQRSRPRRGIEIWDTTCIVTNMASQYVPNCPILINPANPRLSGVSTFPYFPKGGPEPRKEFQPTKDAHPIMGYVSQWGGMEVGQGMMFPANVVDGLVHQLGGKQFLSMCQRTLRTRQLDRVQEGHAIVTPTAGGLMTSTNYQYIIHTVPPFYDQLDNTLLSLSYTNSLQLACKLALSEGGRTNTPIPQGQSNNNPHQQQQSDSSSSSSNPNLDDDDDDDDYNNVIRIACPLLGAGCRGYPLHEAIDIASRTLFEWLVWQNSTTYDDSDDRAHSSTPTSIVLALGIPSSETRAMIIQAFDEEYNSRIEQFSIRQ
jgi:O-acetyl-ADP-ribose deacetylase (regulator of RNase III)